MAMSLPWWWRYVQLWWRYRTFMNGSFVRKNSHLAGSCQYILLMMIPWWLPNWYWVKGEKFKHLKNSMYIKCIKSGSVNCVCQDSRWRIWACRILSRYRWVILPSYRKYKRSPLQIWRLGDFSVSYNLHKNMFFCKMASFSAYAVTFSSLY